MTDSIKLKKAVTTALKDGKVNYKEATRITAAITYDNDKGKLSPADVKLLQKVASLPDSKFEDKKQPDYVKSQRDELREYANGLKEMQNIHFAVTSSAPGVVVKMAKDFAVVDLDSFGFQHERILEVSMKDTKARGDGHIAFEYGAYKVSVDVKKGQTREHVVGRIESALLRQQEAMTTNADDASATTRFQLHRFRPLTPSERKERLEWMNRMDSVIDGGPS